MGQAGHVEFVLNQLTTRDTELADRFEHEIEEAVAHTGLPRLRCRILAWQRGLDVGARDRVTVLLHAPGWVKAFGVSVFASAAEIRGSVQRALSGRPRPSTADLLAEPAGA
jgi:hypothetical protein